MKLLNEKLIVIALASVPLTVLGLAQSATNPVDFSMTAKLTGSLNLDRTNAFSHPTIDFRLSSNTALEARLLMDFTNGGFVRTTGTIGSGIYVSKVSGVYMDGDLLQLSVACDFVNDFGVHNGSAIVTATGDYTEKSISVIAAADNLLLVGKDNPVAVDDDAGGSSTAANYQCTFALATGESLTELYGGNYEATIALTWKETSGSESDGVTGS